MNTAQDLEPALQALVPSILGEDGAIEGLARLSGGASQETWAFDAVGRTGRRMSFILRRAPGGVANPDRTGPPLETEAALIKAAAMAGAPAPGVAHVCAPEDGVGHAFIMHRVEGETIARKILRDEAFAGARARLAGQCGAALAAIHAIDRRQLPDSLETAFGADIVARYEDIYLSFDAPRPIFDLAIQWLRAHVPVPLEPVLVHGDFRLGNLMVDQGGLASVLDWELAHIGDPREDLSWICVNSWRFGQSQNRVGGFGDLNALLDSYWEAGGQPFNPDDIDWWEMLGTLKWGVMCMIMYDVFRTGTDPSVERAAIGRRVSETEIDLINLLERRRSNA